jgi:hypothetical protein
VGGVAVSLEHCDNCTVPPGTRCESAPGNCPYAKQFPDVADCCTTLEEARGVIRRMTARIEDLEDEVNVLRHEV